MLIGRQRESDRLDQVLEAAMAGRGGLRLLGGDPGIGKTRLADEIAERAAHKGFAVSWGRAWETGGAPAYWPWIELLGPLADAEDGELPPRVQALLGGASTQTLAEGTRADPARERFDLFESVSAFVRGCSRKQPLLLVFDDLHMADVASLELLSFVARGLRTSRIVALGTYREAESRAPEIAGMFARLAREGETLPLRPLSSEEVLQLVQRETGRQDPALAAAVHQVTEGNPLFVWEAMHAIDSSPTDVPLEALRDVAAAGGVLALVRGRLAGADPETRAVLEVAATIGREGQLSLLAEAAGKSAADTRALVKNATARGLLVRRGDDRWVFPHGLVREAFYRELPDDRRRALHQSVAHALTHRAGGGVGGAGEALASLAHHGLAALPLGDPIAAVRTACRAAAHARAQLAYEDAIAVLERAYRTCQENGIDDRERAEVALALGWAATEAGSLARGRAIFEEAAGIARRLGDARLLARAALGQGGQYVLAEIRPALLDVLREALTALEGAGGDEERRLRARVLARLAAALTPSATPDEPLGLARRALAMAGDETDVRTRIDVDVGVGAAFADFAPPRERAAVNERLRRDARAVSDRVLELRALTRLACDYLEGGDCPRSDAAITARAALAESIGHPRYQWQTPLLRSMQAMPRGHFAACEGHIQEARTLAAHASDPNAERCIEFHRFCLLVVAGRPDTLRAQEAAAQRTLLSLEGINAAQGLWLTALAAARLGEKERATRALETIESGTANTARMERVTLIEAAILAGFPATYRRLHATFDASDDANACWGPFGFACLPPIARTLAMAAFALGLPDEAVRHCERALALATRQEADAHRAWIHLTWGEGTGSRDHLDRAIELADRLDMPEVSRRARAALDLVREVSPPPTNDPPPGFTLRQDPVHRQWTIEHAGRRFDLPDMRGLGMLARLVDSPGTELHALDLAASQGEGDGDVVDLGDAGEVLDPRARQAYKQRIADLRESLAEAESWRDNERAARIRAELEALSQQLSAAVGLGGRERRTGSAAERARTTVQRRIRGAIKKIADHDRELGRHLEQAVRTGIFCIYAPESR